MDLNDKLEFFSSMILSCHELHFSVYDAGLHLISSTCPDSYTIQNLFACGNAHDILRKYIKQHTKPMVLTNDIGLIWIALPTADDSESSGSIYVLGPCFTTAYSVPDTDAKLSRSGFSPAAHRSASELLRRLPVIAITRIYEYAIMLYYCVTGRRITVSDLHYRESTETRRGVSSGDGSEPRDVHGTYAMEQEMLRMVREGDLNIQQHMSRIAVAGNIGRMALNDAPRQMKDAVIVCAVLFSRASIEGGLTPETALSLTDNYLQSVEACGNVQELAEIAITMQNDFVQRVHNIRRGSLSRAVLECREYIDRHLAEKVSLKDLAAALNYSEYYICRRFKEETGQTMTDYIRTRRLERAKELLTDNSLSIREISERLGFCSASYFSETFRAEFGVTPAEWRKPGGAKK